MHTIRVAGFSITGRSEQSEATRRPRMRAIGIQRDMKSVMNRVKTNTSPISIIAIKDPVCN